MTAILRAWYLASAYSIPVRERELELNSVKKSNTSGTHGFLAMPIYYLATTAIAESLKMAELSR